MPFTSTLANTCRWPLLLLAGCLLAGRINGAPVDAAAQAGWVADASKAVLPATPATGMIHGQPFTVKRASVRKSGGLNAGGLQMDHYTLVLGNSEDRFSFPEFETRLVLAVKKGAKLDGKTFRNVPVPADAPLSVQLERQPGPYKGNPEMQSLTLTGPVNGEPESLDSFHPGASFTGRVEFGQPRGKVLPGKLYLCFNDKNKSYVAGSFNAETE